MLGKTISLEHQHQNLLSGKPVYTTISKKNESGVDIYFNMAIPHKNQARHSKTTLNKLSKKLYGKQTGSAAYTHLHILQLCYLFKLPFQCITQLLKHGEIFHVYLVVFFIGMIGGLQ